MTWTGPWTRRNDPTPDPGYNLADCLRANVLLKAGRPEAALGLVTRIPTERRFRPRERAHRGAQRARPGRAGASEERLRPRSSARWLPRPRPQLMTPFLMVGPALVPLLQERLREGTAHPELIPRMLQRIAAGSTASVNEWGESLTEREHAILRYLATNMSNAEIAETEFISLNTAKTHIAHIYRKLGVSSRRAAIHRAGELGLI